MFLFYILIYDVRLLSNKSSTISSITTTPTNFLFESVTGIDNKLYFDSFETAVGR